MFRTPECGNRSNGNAMRCVGARLLLRWRGLGRYGSIARQKQGAVWSRSTFRRDSSSAPKSARAG
eukprot:3937757-Prymnesium_polylepis.1